MPITPTRSVPSSIGRYSRTCPGRSPLARRTELLLKARPATVPATDKVRSEAGRIARQGHERALLVVDEVEHDVARADAPGLVRDHPGEIRGRAHMTAAQQLLQQLQNPLVTGRRRRWIGSGSNHHSNPHTRAQRVPPVLSIQEHVRPCR